MIGVQNIRVYYKKLSRKFTIYILHYLTSVREIRPHLIPRFWVFFPYIIYCCIKKRRPVCVFGNAVEFATITQARVHSIWIRIAGNERILVLQNDLSIVGFSSRVNKPCNTLMCNGYVCTNTTTLDV